MFNLDTFLSKKVYQEIQVFENASWPFELDSCAFVSMICYDQWFRLLRDSTFDLQMTLSWPDVDSLGYCPRMYAFFDVF